MAIIPLPVLLCDDSSHHVVCLCTRNPHQQPYDSIAMHVLRAHFTCLWRCCGHCGLVLSSSQHRRRPCSLTFSSQTCTPVPTLEKQGLPLSESAAERQAQLGTHHNWLAPAEAWAHGGQEHSPSLITPFIGQLLALLSTIPFLKPLHYHLIHTNTSPII